MKRHHSPELQQIQRELDWLGPHQNGAAGCGCKGGATKAKADPPVSRHPWDDPGGWEATLRSFPRNPYAATEVVQAARPSSPLVPEYLLESNVHHPSVDTSPALSRARDLPRAHPSRQATFSTLEIDRAATSEHNADAQGFTQPRPPPSPPHVPSLVTRIGDDDDWEATDLVDLDDPLSGYPVPSPWDFDLGLECEIHRPPAEPPPEPPNLGQIVQTLPPGVPPVLDHGVTATPRASSTTHRAFSTLTSSSVPGSPPPTTFDMLGPEPPLPPPPQDFLGPGLPLCPPGYEFDYDWQSCWKKGEPPPPIPPGEPRHPHACRCPSPKETYLAHEDRCWVRGSLPHQLPTASADITLHVPPETEGVDSPCPGTTQTWNPDTEQCGKPASGGACAGVYDCCWSNATPQWLKPLTSCNSGNDKDMVSAAVSQAFAWLDPIHRMLNSLWETYTKPKDEEYISHIWNMYTANTDDPDRDISPAYWLCPYIIGSPSSDGPFVLQMVRAIVERGWNRLVNGQIIWCSKGCIHTGAYYTPGTVTLCKSWFDETPACQAEYVLHEVFHLALPFWMTNTPADLKKCSGVTGASNCGSGKGLTASCSSGNEKCYWAACARYLAENKHVTTSIYDQKNFVTRVMPASLRNIDNYVYWCRLRFERLEEKQPHTGLCALPGASTPTPSGGPSKPV